MSKGETERQRESELERRKEPSGFSMISLHREEMRSIVINSWQEYNLRCNALGRSGVRVSARARVCVRESITMFVLWGFVDRWSGYS